MVTPINNKSNSKSHTSFKRSATYRFLTILFLLIIVSVIIAIIYLITSVDGSKAFTEFYILGPDGEADNYPTEVVVNTETSIILGIVNRENIITDYYIQVTIEELTHKELGPITLTDNEKWEQEIIITPNYPGDDQKVEFLLYRQEQEEPYITLYLWIDVTQE